MFDIYYNFYDGCGSQTATHIENLDSCPDVGDILRFITRFYNVFIGSTAVLYGYSIYETTEFGRVLIYKHTFDGPNYNKRENRIEYRNIFNDIVDYIKPCKY